MSRRRIAFKQTARKIADLLVFRIGGRKARGESWKAAGGDEHAAAARKLGQFLQCVQRYALYARQDHDAIPTRTKLQGIVVDVADVPQRIVVKKIQIESRLEHLRHEVSPHLVTKGVNQMDSPSGKM